MRILPFSIATPILGLVLTLFITMILDA